MNQDFANFIETVHPLSKDGTKLNIGNRLYHFLQNAAGHYVAEVINPADQEAILSISAGYRRYQPTDENQEQLETAALGTPGIDSGVASSADPSPIAADAPPRRRGRPPNQPTA